MVTTGLFCAALCVATLSFNGNVTTVEQVTTVSTPAVSTAAESLALLQAGNDAYVAGLQSTADISLDRREETAEYGQDPYAVVITCSDSRVPAEHIFSAGVGDLFVIQTAGNVLDTIAMGSVAYGAEHLDTPLVLVLGHTDCGAVAATLGGGGHGSIASITDLIAAHIGDEDDAHAAEILNVQATMETIAQDEIMAELLAEGKVEIVGAIYDIATGEVTFL